jgi:hypothetical protein
VEARDLKKKLKKGYTGYCWIIMKWRESSAFIGDQSLTDREILMKKQLELMRNVGWITYLRVH